MHFYDATVAQGSNVAVSIDGNLQFGVPSTAANNTTLPTSVMGDFIAPFWDDLSISDAANNQEGVRALVSGAAGNSVLTIEWRAHEVFDDDPTFAFKLSLYEAKRSFRMHYTTSGNRDSATIGVQRGSGPGAAATLWSFNAHSSAGVIDFHPLATVTTGGLGVPAAKTNANVTGTVNPEGLPNEVQFELGRTPTSLTESLVAPQQSGTVDIPLSATFAGLDPGTTCYYRMRATQSDHGGVSLGQIRSFKTDGSSTTAVACSPGAVAVGSRSTCTATVADTHGTTSTPTGSVGFVTNGSGALSGAGSCALAATAIPGVASCSVTTPPRPWARASTGWSQTTAATPTTWPARRPPTWGSRRS